MEIAVAGEALPDQLGADHRPVLLDEAAVGLIAETSPGDAGHAERIDQPVMIVIATTMTSAGRSSLNMVRSPSGKADGGHDDVDRLDADERHDDAAEPVDRRFRRRSGPAPTAR